MRDIYRTLGVIAVILAAGLVGCASDIGTGEDHKSKTLTEGRGEHGRDGRDHHDDGEESSRELGLDDVYDEVRNRVRLKLAYDVQTNTFKGTVENTTKEILRRVRVEVHLSNGTELGPTSPADLDPGEKRNVELSATGKAFDGWTAHSEVGSGQQGNQDGD